MKLLFKLLGKIKHLRFYFFLTVFFALMIAALSLAIPLFMRSWLIQITDLAEFGGITGLPFEIYFIAILIILCYVFQAVVNRINYYVAHKLGWGGMCHMRELMFKHLQRFSPAFFEDKHTGEIVSRIITDIYDLEVFLAHHIPQIITYIIMFTGMLIILSILNIQLTLFTLIPIPLFALIMKKFSRQSKPAYKELRKHQGDLSQLSQETLSGMATVQAFNLEKDRAYEFDKINNNFHRQAMRTAQISGNHVPFIQLILQSGHIFVIVIGGIFLLQGELRIPDLFVFLLYLSDFYNSIRMINNLIDPFQRAITGLMRVFEVLEIEPSIKDPVNVLDPDSIKPEIELCNISFSYNSTESIETLSNIDITIPKNSTVALVGPSGGGKTTITKLICRFYEPDAGVVKIGGYNINDFSLNYLRSKIGMVSQDIFLFSTTIKENIRYGRQDATDEEIIKVAKMANAHDFIMGTEYGYDTYVGERGFRLSGGQKQRISIARAIIKNAPIIIFDEATSSVDVASEAAIQKAVQKISMKKTTIIIAHRLSTILNADKIVVISDGKIIEQGTHQELINANNLYSELVKHQEFVKL